MTAPETALCRAPGCTKPARPRRSAGLCTTHEGRMFRTGSLHLTRPTLGERLLENIELTNSGCWEWTGYRSSDGYGRVGVGGRQGAPTGAHRAAYMELRGKIPSGLVIDHLCRNRACVNPDHLEPVTGAENTRRGEPASRTHCPRGHEYSPTNTSVRDGRRKCLACHRIRQANYLARKALAS